MRIYCDMDDILCETAASLCGLAAREFGRFVAYEDVREFDLQHVFGLSDEEMERFSILSHSCECLRSYPPTPDAPEGLRELRAAGHDIEIVTGRPPSCHVATEEWLASKGLADFPVTYVDKYARAYEDVPGAPRRVPLTELLTRHYDVAIDDSPVVLPALAGWDATRVLVFDRPWNKSYTLAPNMTRVKDWRALVRLLA